MSMNRRDVLRAGGYVAAASALGALGARTATAQSPVRLVVGFPPGGSGDLFARALVGPFAEELGMPVIVDNRPGAGGLTAAVQFVRAPKDGSVLMQHTGSSAITAPISRKVPPYDPVNEFIWIALLSNAPFAIAVHPSIPVKNLKELVAHLKAKKGELSYGHAGIGTTVHLAVELLKDLAGVDVVDVPFQGSGPAITATLGGNVAFICETFGTLMPYHKAGTMRIVTAFASERTKIAPDILTAREEGIDVVSATTNLLAAPSGTPADKLEPIARAINRTMARQSLQDQLTALGIQPVLASNPERAKAFVAAEIERWGRVVKKLNIAL